MNSLARPTTNMTRQWQAHITLGIEPRPGKTVLARTDHFGPLRVQRAFYPESDGCCHIYLLHPPGGLVIGDELKIQAELAQEAQALLTTPSAGKVYGAKNNQDLKQKQSVHLSVKADACLEWLPQETIIFDSAEARLATRVDLETNGKFFGWDIARLGRAASGEQFNSGTCHQSIEIWRDNKPLFIEKNKIRAGEELQNARWGLQTKNTSGTLFATMILSREEIDGLYEKLALYTEESNLWGLTQKQDIFIARYLGNSVSHCRKGFELLWRETRMTFNNKPAVVPRIWNT